MDAVVVGFQCRLGTVVTVDVAVTVVVGLQNEASQDLAWGGSGPDNRCPPTPRRISAAWSWCTSNLAQS
jgi:hypothetical protein